MKKVSFLLIAVVFFAMNSYAQKRFNVGLKAGVATTQVEGDSYSGFNKIGFDGGMYVNGKINDNWSGQFEMLFIQKGSKHNSNPDKNDLTYYYMGLNYLEVPVLLQYHLKKFTFEAGPTFGYLISSKEYNENGAIFMPQPFFKYEIGVATGISYALTKSFSVAWRYENSVPPIRKYASGESRWYNLGQQNIVIAFTVSYQFGTHAKS